MSIKKMQTSLRSPLLLLQHPLVSAVAIHPLGLIVTSLAMVRAMAIDNHPNFDEVVVASIFRDTVGAETTSLLDELHAKSVADTIIPLLNVGIAMIRGLLLWLLSLPLHHCRMPIGTFIRVPAIMSQMICPTSPFIAIIKDRTRSQLAMARTFPFIIQDLIAVKKLKAMNSKAEMEFAVEVEVLGRVRHKNLLGLRGYCVGTDQRLIVYDYMPNLSLLSHLHGQFAGEVQLDWKRRMSIALGSAEGLLYLHHEVTPHIIHRDIKASNVLLDSNFEPLVADFGFAKLIPDGVSHMTTRVKGTLGYLAPEYAMWGKVSESCDVYSFGILLLEIVTGRKPIEKLPGGIKRTITEWAEPFIVKGKFKNLVDPKLRGNFNEEQLKQAINVAALCVQGEPDKRPNMKEVVNILKGYDPKAKVMQTRIQSVKYGEDLMALDQASDDDVGVDDESNAYGVFGSMEIQKMQDPYMHHGDRRRDF